MITYAQLGYLRHFKPNTHIFKAKVKSCKLSREDFSIPVVDGIFKGAARLELALYVFRNEHQRYGRHESCYGDFLKVIKYCILMNLLIIHVTSQFHLIIRANSFHAETHSYLQGRGRVNLQQPARISFACIKGRKAKPLRTHK